MKLTEYLEILESVPEEARIVLYRVKGKREYLTGVLMPDPGTNHKYGLYGIHGGYLNCNSDETDNIYIVSAWPLRDVSRVLNTLYTIHDEIIGEV